jgi:hypothetical protein
MNGTLATYEMNRLACSKLALAVTNTLIAAGNRSECGSGIFRRRKFIALTYTKRN